MRGLTRLICGMALALALGLFACASAEDTCGHARVAERTVGTDACRGAETIECYCADCGAVLSARQENVPAVHAYGEWAVKSPADCFSAEVLARVCALCGAEETASVGDPLSHEWGEIVTVTEPDCETEGSAYHECVRCGSREEFLLPALGHDEVEEVIAEPSPQSPGRVEITCARCGALLESYDEEYRCMMYDQTVTSLGPRTRDLIGGQEWYRVTPLDLGQNGVFTYPLIASDRYTVGTMTASVNRGSLTVSYRLDSAQVRVNSEALIIYPDLAAMWSAAPVFYDLGTPIDMGQEAAASGTVILSLLIRADYDAADAGVSEYTEDAAQIAAMRAMIH